MFFDVLLLRFSNICKFHLMYTSRNPSRTLQFSVQQFSVQHFSVGLAALICPRPSCIWSCSSHCFPSVSSTTHPSACVPPPPSLNVLYTAGTSGTSSWLVPPSPPMTDHLLTGAWGSPWQHAEALPKFKGFLELVVHQRMTSRLCWSIYSCPHVELSMQNSPTKSWLWKVDCEVLAAKSWPWRVGHGKLS